jgi:hypothetical protein
MMRVFGIVLLLTTMTSGCTKVLVGRDLLDYFSFRPETANAKSDPLPVFKLENFPITNPVNGNDNFNYKSKDGNGVILFLWKPEGGALGRSIVMKAGNDIDLGEKEALSLEDEQSALNLKYAEKDEERTKLVSTLRVKDRLLKQKQSELEKAKPEGNQSKIEEITKAIGLLLSQIDELKLEKGVLEQALAPFDLRTLQIAQRRDELYLLYRDVYLAKIKANCIPLGLYNDDVQDPFQSKAYFTLDDTKQISIQIENWDLNDGFGAQKFTTENGAIHDVSYEELGGRLNFTATALAGDIYRFALSRAGYNAGEDSVDSSKTVLFRGDIFRTKDGLEMSGKAKFTMMPY